MVVGFVISLVLGVAALYWMILRNSSARIMVQYEKLAKRYGLELHAPPPGLGGFIRPEPSVFGTVNDREMSISVPGKGMQNTRQIETVLKLELKDKRFAAQIAVAGPLGGWRQRDSGGQVRWKSGQADFDSAVDIRSNVGQKLGMVLSEERCAWLIDHLKKYKGSIYIGDGVMAYAELGLISNDAAREHFEDVVAFLTSLAETIESF